jgi:hypothetical protein
MLDYLEHDRPLAGFLGDFPTVDRALAVGVIARDHRDRQPRVGSHVVPQSL